VMGVGRLGVLEVLGCQVDAAASERWSSDHPSGGRFSQSGDNRIKLIKAVEPYRLSHLHEMYEMCLHFFIQRTWLISTAQPLHKFTQGAFNSGGELLRARARTP
jgi:hypothetical protein